MFTGIVEELGHVRAVHPVEGGLRLEVACDRVVEDAVPGASIAVNGCCLTVVEVGPGWWAADVQVESLRRTALDDLRPGDPVNLERPLRLGDRLGGHLVQGHVDGVGRLRARVPEADGSVRVHVEAPATVLRYLVEKGSVAVDGVSLTVVDVDDERFSAALVPHTLAVTTLGAEAEGARVNLEVDMIAKYVERLASPALPRE